MHPLFVLFADNQCTKYAVSNFVDTVQLSGELRVCGEIDQIIISLSFIINLISESALASLLIGVHCSVLLDQLGELVYQSFDAFFTQFCVQYHDGFVFGICHL